MSIIVQVENDDGSTSKVRVDGHAVELSTSSVVLEPTYVKQVKTNLNSNSEAITDQCGRTEVRSEGHTNWNVSIDGIITANQLSSLQSLGAAETIDVVTDVLGEQSGSYVVEELSITHEDELNTIEVPAGGDSAHENAYSFQIQLKAPE